MSIKESYSYKPKHGSTSNILRTNDISKNYDYYLPKLKESFKNSNCKSLIRFRFWEIKESKYLFDNTRRIQTYYNYSVKLRTKAQKQRKNYLKIL